MRLFMIALLVVTAHGVALACQDGSEWAVVVPEGGRVPPNPLIHFHGWVRVYGVEGVDGRPVRHVQEPFSEGTRIRWDAVVPDAGTRIRIFATSGSFKIRFVDMNASRGEVSLQFDIDPTYGMHGEVVEPRPERVPVIEVALALFGLACGVLLCRRLAARAG